MCVETIYSTSTTTPLTLPPHSNCEELVIQGPESKQDLRVVNSYPMSTPNTMGACPICEPSIVSFSQNAER